MKNIVFAMLCLLLMSFATSAKGQVRLWEKPFDYRELPAAFVAIPLPMYEGVVLLQQTCDSLVRVQQNRLSIYEQKVKTLERLNKTQVAEISEYQRIQHSYERELSERASENISLQRKAKRNRWLLPVGSVLGFVGGVLLAK